MPDSGSRNIRDLLNWVLFQLLIGNSDAHGKNISFYVGRDGIDVAPAYDLVNLEIYGELCGRDLAMAVGDTFEFNGIHAHQLADMCEECKLPQKRVVTALNGLCTSLIKAVDSFDLSRHLIDDKPAFGQGVLDAIKANCLRFLEISKELQYVQL
ncbi:MAG: HipA domain-containing protein [Desulfobulbaceae bacterium]|nr:HipA domain-containing protein [Desulfobulbaceae bacterium]